MGRSLLLVIVSCAVLLAGYVGTVSADPLKNYRLIIPASCEDGERFEFRFVINGEGVAGHIIGSTSNIIPVEDTVTLTYTDPKTGTQVTTEPVFDSLGRGKKKGLQSDLKSCSGTATYNDPVLGWVSAHFDIRAFFTPRG
jgi:hypothetical protein